MKTQQSPVLSHGKRRSWWRWRRWWWWRWWCRRLSFAIYATGFSPSYDYTIENDISGGLGGLGGRGGRVVLEQPEMEPTESMAHMESKTGSYVRKCTLAETWNLF